MSSDASTINAPGLVALSAIVPGIPPAEPRVVATSHATDGTSIFSADTTLPIFHPFGPAMSGFTVFDVKKSVPANNQEAAQGWTGQLPRCPPGGVIFCISDYPAGTAVPMHRTLSVDYCIVLTGEIVIRLDNGEERTVCAGEFIIQGGANHQWFNRTDQVCRMAFVMVSAAKVKLADGTELEETVIKR
ncbi:hypothetical protein TWF694_003880 [Orbilia ellipsospora]|uniref:Cupin type-2 domain-containing protein n=1 Tax=Orbilia ellipsospora TaxID=2528407 RepID=A0AAV9WZU6_9PEZI